jgi:hypothetical protein
MWPRHRLRVSAQPNFWAKCVNRVGPSQQYLLPSPRGHARDHLPAASRPRPRELGEWHDSPWILFRLCLFHGLRCPIFPVTHDRLGRPLVHPTIGSMPRRAPGLHVCMLRSLGLKIALGVVSMRYWPELPVGNVLFMGFTMWSSAVCGKTHAHSTCSQCHEALVFLAG